MIYIISQESGLLSRYNPYPFEEYSDVNLWDALEKIKLKLAIIELHSIYLKEAPVLVFAKGNWFVWHAL